MSPLSVVAAAIAIAGAVVAVSARDLRLSLFGLAAALLLAPLAGYPAPTWAALGARTTASLLGLELVWIATRDARRPVRGSAIGWPSEALAAAAAAAVGWGAAGSAQAVLGRSLVSPEALAGGLALAVLSVGPLFATRDTFRLGIGMALVATAAGLVWAGVDGAPGAMDQLVAGALGLGALGSLALLVRAETPAH